VKPKWEYLSNVLKERDFKILSDLAWHIHTEIEELYGEEKPSELWKKRYEEFDEAIEETVDEIQFLQIIEEIAGSSRYCYPCQQNVTCNTCKLKKHWKDTCSTSTPFSIFMKLLRETIEHYRIAEGR